MAERLKPFTVPIFLLGLAKWCNGSLGSRKGRDKMTSYRVYTFCLLNKADHLTKICSFNSKSLKKANNNKIYQEECLLV